jgi:hypothetical protein
LYTTSEKPRYLRGLISNLALFIVIIVLVVLTTLYLAFLNKRHANRRVALGKAADVVDQSMEDSNAWAKSDADAGPGRRQSLDKAFDDETDLRNEDFIYVY